MPTLALNGITVSSIMSLEDPSGERRDIGDEAMGSDGSLRITRQTRKRDLKFKTTPLSAADSHAWESLFIGEGEVWSFNSSLYGSKGLGPSASVDATIVAGSAKFGAAKLNLAATTGSISYANSTINLFNGSLIRWTIAVWYSTDAGATWNHYMLMGPSYPGASGGLAAWVNGVRNDAGFPAWLTAASLGTVTIANATGGAVQFDDLVILPYWGLATWPPVIGIATRAFPPLPYLEASGSMVTETEYRVVLGAATESFIKTAGAGFKANLSVLLRAK